MDRCVAAVVVLTMGWSVAAASQPDAATAYREGVALFRKKDLDGAIRRFDQALARNPGHASALLYKGRALTALGRAEEAIPILDHSISVARKPRSWFEAPHYEKGAALMTLSRPAEAVTSFTQAIRHDPTSRAYTGRATAYVALAKPSFDKGGGRKYLEQALLDMKRAVQENPRVPAVWALKAELHFLLKDQKEGLAAAKRACELGDCRVMEKQSPVEAAARPQAKGAERR